MQEQMNPTPEAKSVELKELETEVKKPKENKDAKKKAADDCCAPLCGPSTCG